MHSNNSLGAILKPAILLTTVASLSVIVTSGHVYTCSLIYMHRTSSLYSQLLGPIVSAQQCKVWFHSLLCLNNFSSYLGFKGCNVYIVVPAAKYCDSSCWDFSIKSSNIFHSNFPIFVTRLLCLFVYSWSQRTDKWFNWWDLTQGRRQH